MSSSSSLIYPFLFFALVYQIPAASSDTLSPFWKQEAAVLFTSSGTIESPSAYHLALQQFRDAFTYNSTKELCGHPFLPDQTMLDEAPYMWIPIHLSGWDGDEVTLLFRNDNMKLAGFANKTGTWFSFKGFEHLIPGSIPTGITTGTFSDIADNLSKIPLGKDALKLAVRNLTAGFDPTTARSARDKDHATVSAAQVMIMFPGALRFFPIRRKVMEGWESGCFLDELGERALLVSWKDITVSLIKWNETRRWEPLILTAVTSLYKIESAEDALRVGDLLFIPLRYGF